MGMFDWMKGKKSAGTVVDPVCHMSIDSAKAAGQSTHGSQTYYFCSGSCKKAFDADPHKYLGAHTH